MIYYIGVEYLGLNGLFFSILQALNLSATGAANLVMIIKVRYWGLYGVVLSAILSAGVVSAPWITHDVFHQIFEGKTADYLRSLARYLLAVLLATAASFCLTGLVKLSGIPELICKLLISMACANGVCYLLLHQTAEFQKAKKMMIDMVRKVIG